MYDLSIAHTASPVNAHFIKEAIIIKIMDQKEFDAQNVFGLGQPNTAYAQYFTGDSFLNPLTRPQDGLFLANVTFEPGCRNNWHIHHASKGGGQMLICVAGRGWYQEWGQEARALRPGDVVNIPPEVKHWHGAAPDSWFSHLAIEVPGEGCSNEWLEAVTDEVVSVVRKGLEENPDIGAVVLECTDLPPYSARIRDELGIPVFDINTMISYVALSLNEYKMF